MGRSVDEPPSGPVERTESRAISRRSVLQGTVATASLAAGLAGVPSARAQAGSVDYGGWFDGVDNFDGTTVDARGTAEVTVDVGADGNSGTYAFSPPAVRIDPGTTVMFEWVSDTHNVVPESQPSTAGWEGHVTIDDTGTTYTHTFEVEGVYTYYCEPHRSLGMKGAIVVGDVGGNGGGAAGPAIDPAVLGLGAVVLSAGAFVIGTVFGARLRHRDVSDAGLFALFAVVAGLVVLIVVVSKLVMGW